MEKFDVTHNERIISEDDGTCRDAYIYSLHQRNDNIFICGDYVETLIAFLYEKLKNALIACGLMIRKNG